MFVPFLIEEILHSFAHLGGLHWTLYSLSTSLLYWEDQNWIQHSRCDFMSPKQRARIIPPDLLSTWFIWSTTYHPFNLSNFHYFLGMKVIFSLNVFWVFTISTKKLNHITTTYAAFNEFTEGKNLSTRIILYKIIFKFSNLYFFNLMNFCISKIIYTPKIYQSFWNFIVNTPLYSL